MDYVLTGAYRTQPNFQRYIEHKSDKLREQGITVDVLKDGDSVSVIKDLKIKGTQSVVKVGTKVKNIRLCDKVYACNYMVHFYFYFFISNNKHAKLMCFHIYEKHIKYIYFRF
jgi:hypothetical protein